MFSWLQGKHSVRANSRRATKLLLQSLDDRIVPSAPSITTLSGEIIGGTIVVYGQVTDDSSGGSSSSGTGSSGPDTVTISGAVNDTVTVSNTGEFCFAASYSGDGDVVVYATSGTGVQSSNNTLSVVPTGNPNPIITLQSVNNADGTITLSGTVYDQSPASLTVTLAGAVSAETTTDSQGNFSIIVSPSQSGTVYATTVDAAGTSSDTAEIALAPTPPTIDGLTWARVAPGTYVFTGTVVGPNAPGSTVTLNGTTPGVNGATGTVGDDGTFTITVIVPTGTSGGGLVTATTTDSSGQSGSESTILTL